MKPVGRAIVGPRFPEYLSNKEIALGVPPLFGQQLRPRHLKLEMPVTPVVLTGVGNKLIQDTKRGIYFTGIFKSRQKHVFRLNLSNGIRFKGFEPPGQSHQLAPLILSRPEQHPSPQCLHHYGVWHIRQPHKGVKHGYRAGSVPCPEFIPRECHSAADTPHNILSPIIIVGEGDERVSNHGAVAAHMAVSHKVMIFRPRRILRKLRRVNGLKHPQRAVGIAPHNILGVAYLPVMPRTRLRARRNDKCKNDRQQIYQIPHRFSFYLFSHREDSCYAFPSCHQVVIFSSEKKLVRAISNIISDAVFGVILQI